MRKLKSIRPEGKERAAATRMPGDNTEYRGTGTIGALRQRCPEIAQREGGQCGWKGLSEGEFSEMRSRSEADASGLLG